MAAQRYTFPAHGLATKCFALFVAFALWMMPQMLNARNMATVCDEFGARPLPVTEEEEIKHAYAPFAWNGASNDAAERRDEDPPPADERVEVAVHGDVAVPPPKQGR